MKSARNMSWPSRKALKVLGDSYGPDIKIASVRTVPAENRIEVALFGELMTEKDAEQFFTLLAQDATKVHFFIPSDEHHEFAS